MTGTIGIGTESGARYTGRPWRSGGQADLFLIEGRRKVAKIYKGLGWERAESQCDRLRSMVASGPPSPAFVWPLDIVEEPSAGYIMDLVEDHTEIGLLGHTKYLRKVDLRTRLRICYRLVEAFEKLHQRTGYAYCDLSGNNILCSTETGDVRIIDTDNLWVEGVVAPSTVLGTYRCMAPELEAGLAAHPSVETDLHSLAVLIFMTLLFHHPLLGDRVHDDASLEANALGKGALYIYHPTDGRNRYTRYAEYGGIPVTLLPGSLQRLFRDSFVEGLHSPNLRVRETNWKKELADRLDGLVRCPNPACLGRQTPLGQPDAASATCIWCGTLIRDLRVMRFSDPSTGRALRHKVLYGDEVLVAHHCKLDGTFHFGLGEGCARVEDGAAGLTLRNISREDFSYYAPGEATPRPFPPGKRVRLQPGYRVVFGARGAAAQMVV